ncbi:hypothetical protein GLOIN_2v1868682 [Rhizophagus irregularis DAOM 181602=DAOM 197198]|nr:hypothetical protein RirG_094650 [Rhizophagus irregularis DAOM 197198w]GBC23174.1 hypothetical protein GLOIN_2v1868682 [Rhizophagus irregularis DAOM 181602=DAOM 197198]CAB5181676.1 unnamed protein product [Rhizophagus irregularis]
MIDLLDMMNHILSYNDNVRYLLEYGELEGRPKWRDTDLNWSPEVYNIGEVRVQKISHSFISYLVDLSVDLLGKSSYGVELPPKSILLQ